MDLPQLAAAFALASLLGSTGCSTMPMDPGGNDDSSSSDSSSDGSFDASDDESAEPKLDVFVPPDVGIVCIEPEGTRVTVVDCDPCGANSGFGAPVSDPVSWIVTRLVPPSYPYRIDTLIADVRVDEPFEMFWLVDDFEVPPIEPVFADSIDVEVAYGELATWQLETPIVLDEGEFLFVGLTMPAGASVSNCEQDTEDEYRVFDSPAVTPAEWVPLLDVAPIVFAYGEPA